jgi:hypothetical protein
LIPELSAVFTGSYGLVAAAALIFLAGLSDGAGTRAVVLLVNRTTPIAFTLSLLVSALLYLLSAALWIGGVWLAATRLFSMNDALPHFFYVLSLAYAPLLLSALALLPLVGPLIRLGLRLWSFAVGFTLLTLLGLTPWQAALCAALGALLVALAGWALSEPATRIAERLWAVLLRSPFPARVSDLPRVIPGYAPNDKVAS